MRYATRIFKLFAGASSEANLRRSPHRPIFTPTQALSRELSRPWAAHHVPRDEPRLLKRIVELATQYGRYGCRRVTALLHRGVWQVNHNRVERIWRQEGAEGPAEATEARAALVE